MGEEGEGVATEAGKVGAAVVLTGVGGVREAAEHQGEGEMGRNQWMWEEGEAWRD